MKTISIVIPVWNGANLIAACLRSLEPQLSAGDEIILVDNSSTDGTPELVEREFPRVRVARMDRNWGYGGGANRGIALAQGDAFLILNHDITFQEGCLAALRQRLMESGPGIIGCKLLYPDGKTIQHAGGIVRMPHAEPDHAGYRQLDDGRWDQLAYPDYVTGALFVIDRAVADTIGVFDEEFFPLYFEETDYCYRARAAGFPVIYEPAAVALHHESQTYRPHSAAYFQAMHRGRLRFLLKHQTVDQFCDEFVPAESQWLSAVQSRVHRRIMVHVYVHTMLAVPHVYAARSPVGDATVVTRVLNGLSALSLRALAPA